MVGGGKFWLGSWWGGWVVCGVERCGLVVGVVVSCGYHLEPPFNESEHSMKMSQRGHTSKIAHAIFGPFLIPFPLVDFQCSFFTPPPKE